MSWFDKVLGKKRNVLAERERLLMDKVRIEKERRSILPRVQDREEWAGFYSNVLRILEAESIHPAARLLIMEDEDVLVTEMIYQLNQSPIDQPALDGADANVRSKLRSLVEKVRSLQDNTVSSIMKQEQSGFFQKLKKAREDNDMQRLSFEGVNGKLNGLALVKKKLSILTNPAIDPAGKLVWIESEEARNLSTNYFSLLNSLAESHSMEKELELHSLEVAVNTVIDHEVRSANVALNPPSGN